MPDIAVGSSPNGIACVDIQRIAGDIYVNGTKIAFAVDYHKSTKDEFNQVDWLLGWAKIGLMSQGFTVPCFASAPLRPDEEIKRNWVWTPSCSHVGCVHPPPPQSNFVVFATFGSVAAAFLIAVVYVWWVL